MSPETERLSSFITDLLNQGFWGNITLKLQGGKVIHITKEESLKPSQLGPEYRRNNESNIHN
jgi:hypothetical protein